MGVLQYMCSDVILNARPFLELGFLVFLEVALVSVNGSMGPCKIVECALEAGPLARPHTMPIRACSIFVHVQTKLTSCSEFNY